MLKLASRPVDQDITVRNANTTRKTSRIDARHAHLTATGYANRRIVHAPDH
jgi:hypothetical protein